VDYKTLEKIRITANDPSASPAEREFAERQLHKAATALVVVEN
jgi:hypothetical protein